MKWIKYAIVVTGAACFLYGCGGNGESEALQFKIGAVLSTTGQYGNYGQSIKQGLEIGVDTINKEGGVKGQEFSIVVKDAGSTVEGAKKAFEELANEGCDIIIGAETTELTKALVPLAAEYDIPIISPSASSTSVTKDAAPIERRYFFRICPTDDREAKKIAEEIPQPGDLPFIKRPYLRVLTLIRKGDSYTEGLWHELAMAMNEFELKYESPPYRYDHTLLQAEPGEGGFFNEQMQEILAKAKEYQTTENEGPKRGCIVILGFAEDVEKLLKAFNTAGLEVQVYTTSAAASTSFIKEAGDLADGLIFPSIFKPQHSRYAGFESAYTEKFGEEPDLYAAYGYDTAMLLGKTFDMTQNVAVILDHPQNLWRAMNKAEWHGLTGPVEFSIGSHEVAKTFRLYTLVKDKNGKLILKDLLEHRADMLAEAKRRQQEALRNGS